ncbi:MAG: hypothetical protein AB1744_10320, partial [Candidatus Zixiibacteriota bacterium]
MTKRLPLLMLLSVALVAFMAMSAFAAKSPTEKKLSPAAYEQSLIYSFPDAQTRYLTRPDKDVQDQAALGAFSPAAFPGRKIGDTWYDYQRNGSMRRMITWGTHGAPDTLLVHFSWMRLPTSDIALAREYRYDVYNAAEGIFGTETGLQNDDEYAGYCGITATNDNRAVVGGHNNPGTGVYQTQIYWDFGQGTSFFNTSARVPDATAEYCDFETGGTGGIWPAFEYVEGTDTVTHVIAQESRPGAGDAQTLYYFRKVGVGAAGTWDHPPRCIDTVADIAQDIEATDDGMVVLFWIANVQDPSDPCNGGDTCSSTNFVEAVQRDNDVYVQISNDYGVTWQPRMNITKNTYGVSGFRPYTDLSGLIDGSGVVHCVYGTGDYDAAGPTWYYRGRMFHWDNASNNTVIAVNYMYDQTDCPPHSWNLNASKMTLSECNGKFYILFTQCNDPDLGPLTDCSEEGSGPECNGELYISVSDDGGSTWDKPRNITNTHTPGCDSLGGVNGPCESEHWPSMVR